MTDCTVGDYLLGRLKELGIRHVFGVPGDPGRMIELHPAAATVAGTSHSHVAMADALGAVMDRMDAPEAVVRIGTAFAAADYHHAPV
jgi:hypothetical protein